LAKSQRRIASIFEAVQQGGHQPLQRLAKTLGVSEMTIRRDVAGTDGRLAVLGGKVVLGRELSGGYALDSELNSHALAKLAASRHAATLIGSEDTVFVDCGSTMAHLAGLLPSDQTVTVVTYALNIASIVARNPGIRLVMIGGVYHEASAAFSGGLGLGVLEGVRINKAFVSAGGVHRTLGVSCSNFYEVPAKLAAIRNAADCYVLADKSKYGQVKPAHFAELETFAGYINEEGVFDAETIALEC
jgi:DeoR family transcriptional regulator, deoxyribose operon repressor